MPVEMPDLKLKWDSNCVQISMTIKIFCSLMMEDETRFGIFCFNVGPLDQKRSMNVKILSISTKLKARNEPNLGVPDFVSKCQIKMFNGHDMGKPEQVINVTLKIMCRLA